MGEVESGAVAPVEPVVAESTAPEAVQPEQTPTAEPVSDEKPVERTFTQKELDEIVQRRLAKESRRLDRESRERANLMAEREYYKRLAEDKAPAQKSPDAKPVPQDYGDYEQYTEALTEWKLEQKLQSIRQESAQQQQQRQQADFAAKASEKLMAGAQKYEDFDEVVGNPDLRVTREMAAAIVETDTPDEVSYWLGNNPSEAARIAALPPVKQIWEIANIAGKFRKQATPTKTPPPITPNTGNAPASKDIWSNDTKWDDFVAARRKAMGKR